MVMKVMERLQAVTPRCVSSNSRHQPSRTGRPRFPFSQCTTSESRAASAAAAHRATEVRMGELANDGVLERPLSRM